MPHDNKDRECAIPVDLIRDTTINRRKTGLAAQVRSQMM